MHFIYKAKKANGEIYSAEKDLDDRFQLYKLIRESGEEIVSIKETRKSSLSSKRIFSFMDHIKMLDKINLAKNMGLMIESGLPLARAISVLERQSTNKSLKKVLSNILDEINKGNTLSDSLAKHPKVFPPIFISMVHAGEQSGTLPDSLKSIATQMETSYNLEKRVRGALIYPALIVTLMIVIAILMLIFVIPTLLKTFSDMKVELPFTTRVVLEISNLAQNHGPIILIILIIISILFYLWSKKESGKIYIHAFLLKLPIIGLLIQEVNTARTARTLSSLLKAGVDVLEAMSITREVVQNVYFKKIISIASDAVKKGDPISKVFSESTNFYPVFFAEMIGVGEETGQISTTLEEVAKFYEADVEDKTKNMSSVIEPFLMIMVGAAVGFFAVSMISPMYSLVNVI